MPATWSLILNQTGDNQPGRQDLVIRTDQSTDTCSPPVRGRVLALRPSGNTDAAGSGAWEPVFTAHNMSRTSLALAPSDQRIIYAVAASSEDGDYYQGVLGVYRSLTQEIWISGQRT